MSTLISIDPSNSLRTKIYLMAAGVCLVLSAGSLLSSQSFMAATGLLFAGLLYGNSRLLQKSGEKRPPMILSHVMVFCLMLVTLASVTHFPGQAEHWSYILPLIAYLIYPLRLATALTAGYSVAFAIAIIVFYHGPEKPQLFFIYLLSLVVTLAFVYLREIKEKQLQPLRRTDNLTLALTRECLQQDLHREIQRCEREGTSLSVLALSLDEKTLRQSRPDDKDGLLHRMGRLLHENLRLFDTYYRYESAEIIILLPYTSSRAAARKAYQLRQKIREQLSSRELDVTASVGLATLNVGDTPASMIESARKALGHAQSRGSNQTRTFVALEESQ